jgi:hypothetical protein
VPVDVAWRDADGRQYIAEVKSVVGANDVDQLRLGLGQVLEYRHRLDALGLSVTAVMLVSACVGSGVARRLRRQRRRPPCRDNVTEWGGIH